ncbi:MAG TPA: hypothetical protein VGE07_13780 [Herpetosiphonaceae bacterium]
MKQRIPTPQNRPNAPSLADTLNAGAGVFLRRWWVLIIPMLIDSWLRWGPPLSAPGLADWVGAALGDMLRFMGASGAQSEQAAGAIGALGGHDLRTAGVATQLMPSLLSANLTAPAGLSLAGWQAAPLLIGLNLAALLASSLFLLPLADAIRQQPAGRAWLRRLLPAAWQLGAYLLLVLGVQLLLGLPALLCSLWLLAISPLAAQILGTAWLAAMLAVWVYASFGVEAILVDEPGPLVAAYRSYNIVHARPWPALALVGAVFVLTYGFRFLLGGMLSTPWGTLLASAAYGALVAALSAARMLFYRDRLALLARTRPVFMAPGSEV